VFCRSHVFITKGAMTCLRQFRHLSFIVLLVATVTCERDAAPRGAWLVPDASVIETSLNHKPFDQQAKQFQSANTSTVASALLAKLSVVTCKIKNDPRKVARGVLSTIRKSNRALLRADVSSALQAWSSLTSLGDAAGAPPGDGEDLKDLEGKPLKDWWKDLEDPIKDLSDPLGAAKEGEDLEEEEAEKDPALVLFELSAYFCLIGIPSIFAHQYNSKVVSQCQLPDEDHIREPKFGVFKFGLCSCAGDIQYCLHSVCCSYARHAHTLTVTEENGFWGNYCLLFTLGNFLCCFFGCFVASQSAALRRKLKLQDGWLVDCILSCCCWPLFVGQQAMAVDEAAGVRVSCCCKLEPLKTNKENQLVGEATNANR